MQRKSFFSNIRYLEQVSVVFADIFRPKIFCTRVLNTGYVQVCVTGTYRENVFSL